MNHLDLCIIKFGLECIEVKIENPYRLDRMDGSTCDDIEQICIAHDVFNDGGYFLFFGNPLLSEKWDFFKNGKEFFESDELAKSIIPTIELRRELWYHFPIVPKIDCPLVTELGDTPATFDTFAILENGEWVSRAWSVRRNEKSAEIAVETKETHRRKGYGSQVVSAWAKSQISKGKIAIYGHRKYNLESKYLAEKVGAVLFADVLSLQ